MRCFIGKIYFSLDIQVDKSSRALKNKTTVALIGVSTA